MANAPHHGGCHCGAVRYTVTLDTAGEAIECNGSGPRGPMVAINVRCLDDVDVFTQPRKRYEGKQA